MDFSKVKTIGRTYLLDDKLFMNFSGSGVIFKMKGNKLIIKLFATKYDNDTNRPYISVIINEVRKDYALTEEHNIIEINLTDQPNKFLGHLIGATTTITAIAAGAPNATTHPFGPFSFSPQLHNKAFVSRSTLSQPRQCHTTTLGSAPRIHLAFTNSLVPCLSKMRSITPSSRTQARTTNQLLFNNLRNTTATFTS